MYFKLNDSGNTTCQNLREKAKTACEEKFVVSNIHFIKEKFKIADLHFCLRKLEKEQQIKTRGRKKYN